MIGVGLILILVSAQLNPGFLPMNHVECLEDNFFIWTNDLNVWLHDASTFKNAFTIILGLCMDFLGLKCFYEWTKNIHRSWTFPLALCAVYALKLLVQMIFYMAVPDDSLWEFPGMYSIFM